MLSDLARGFLKGNIKSTKYIYPWNFITENPWALNWRTGSLYFIWYLI